MIMVLFLLNDVFLTSIIKLKNAKIYLALTL